MLTSELLDGQNLKSWCVRTDRGDGLGSVDILRAGGRKLIFADVLYGRTLI